MNRGGGSWSNQLSLRRILATAPGALLVLTTLVLAIGPARAAASPSVQWGIDTTDNTQTDNDITATQADLGNPEFVGRYVTLGSGTPLGSSEASYLLGLKLGILLIASPSGSTLTTASKASSDATGAIDAAKTLGVPSGAAIYRDVEEGDDINKAYIEDWYSDFQGSGYVPGFYEDSASGDFKAAYCGAVSANAAIGTGTVLYSSEPSAKGANPDESAAPTWGPTPPDCTNNTVAWQYEIKSNFPSGKTAPNVDVDEYLSQDWNYLWGGTGGGSPPPATSILSTQSVSQGPSGTVTEAVEGPSDTLWVYWEASNAQWYGPLGVGATGSTYSAPAVATNSSGLPTVAVEGPDNSLYVYWENSNATWSGPLGVGAANSTYSAPSIAIGPSGLPTVAVEGPDNSLYVYWENSNATWSGPLGVGAANSTYSAPSIAASSTGYPTVAVQGPSDSLWVYWEASNAQWYGPLGVGASGSTNSSPDVAIGGTGLPTVAVQGPSDSLWVYWEASNAQWYGPLGVGASDSTTTSPSISVGPSSSDLPYVGTLASGDGLWVYWQESNGDWTGPLGVGTD